MLRKLIVPLVFLASVGAASAQPVPPLPPCRCVLPPGVTVDYHRVTIDVADRIAMTTVEMKFTNNGEGLAEGQFLFPLPMGAAVQELVMFIDGQAIEAKLLRADEARAIYNEIVRQYRDPALLEYVGRDLIQANVFPIPARESRQIRIVYGQALSEENCLVKVVYPLRTPTIQNVPVGQVSVQVNVSEPLTIGNVYSPSHRIALSRPQPERFRASFEASGSAQGSDFVLYYGVQREEVGLNLLTYRESADGDGFFMLMVQPPTTRAEEALPKDIVIVLDQSGSMNGDKWRQAQAAAIYVLEHLNPRDRFGVVLFSSEYRAYAPSLLPAREAAGAIQWVRAATAEGGTNILDALMRGFAYDDTERPLTVLFLTDGLPTEGETDRAAILQSMGYKAPARVRVFTFGVGFDVDTFLLDALARDLRGTSTYVQPGERIDEAVAALYNRISAPVLQDVTLTVDGVTVELLYPRQMPDLFAGEQLTVVGRYRGGGTATITLTGQRGAEAVTLRFDDQAFRATAGGTEFIARLWATRRIGDLLNQIRLNGETSELVESVVSLSIRYGIITPYTSFLITEDDILTQAGQNAAQQDFQRQAGQLAGEASGAGAVSAADLASGLANAQAPVAPSVMRTAPMPLAQPTATAPGGRPLPPAGVPGLQGAEMMAEPAVTETAIRYVGEKTFILQGGVWMDTTYQPDTMTPRRVAFGSDEYFDLVLNDPELAQYLAVGERVIVVWQGEALEIVAE
ncbi:VIT domain-containing protein [Aggregatilineales bacterium SYSU G02658]